MENITFFLLTMGISGPESGKILLNEKQLGSEISGKNQFAYVLQGNTLFSETIKDSILLIKIILRKR